MTALHEPVLMDEVLTGLAIKPDGYYVDATFGRGGHSQQILNRLGPQGRLLALDKDPAAVAYGQQSSLAKDERFELVHATFTELKKIISERGQLGKVAGVLMDLGVSSPQLDDPQRGFSFTREGPLDMRMNPTQGMDAATWINSAPAEEIATVLRDYGEERYARRIAKAIVQTAKENPFKTTKELADCIAVAAPMHERHKNPATRSFQAIRIFINREMEELPKALSQCYEVLAEGGRMCVISFHSLEDRVVKRFIHAQSHGKFYPPDLPIKEIEIQKKMRKIGSLIRPTQVELSRNQRARSARLRIAEKIQ